MLNLVARQTSSYGIELRKNADIIESISYLITLICMIMQEIRERLEPSHTKAAEPEFGPYFRIYVGNLPRKVDSCQLRQFFSKHGKVADARIMCHTKTKHSRGFGFVTMATAADDEPSHAVSKLDGRFIFS